MKSTKHPYRQNIQYPEDGRGRRNVYLNNQRVIACFYTNPRRNFVKVYVFHANGHPAIDKHGKHITRKLRGKVTIKPINKES